jgi:multisubunit Na+/H+ antiporter MnhB subunit
MLAHVDLHVLYFIVGFILGAMTAVALGYSLAVEHGHPRARFKLLLLTCAIAIGVGALVGWAVNAFFDFVPRLQY